MAKQNLTQAAKQLNQRKKLLIILVAAVFAIILIYSIGNLIYRAGKTKTIIHFAPNAAAVTLNDTKVSNDSTSWIIPGKYHLKVSFNEHFSVYEEDIEITNETAELYGLLSALDDEGREYATQHRQEFTVVEGLVGDLLDREGQKKKEKYPILNYIPINNSLYSISYQYKNDEPEIYVKSDPKYLDVAVAKMKLFENISLEEQNIIFLNTNEFENYQQNPIADVRKFLRAAYQLSSEYIISEPAETSGYIYATIYKNGHDYNADYAHYRVILKKNANNNWQVISTPQPLLTVYNTPNVDKEILKTINSY